MGGGARLAWAEAQVGLTNADRARKRASLGQGVGRHAAEAAAVDVGRTLPPARPPGTCESTTPRRRALCSRGGADLTGNTGTELKDQASSPSADPDGRQLHFGIREHGMGGI